ncbi:MAG: tetratricopeptide repeat protein, partial [Pseudomonadota bacterium]
AVHAEHYDAATFADKLHRALTGDGQGQFQARGRASAPHPARNRVLAPLLAVSIALAAVVAYWYVQSAGTANDEALADTAVSWPATIAIAPPKNLTGKADFDWLGSGLSNLISDDLARSRYVQMVSAVRWQNLTAAASAAGGDTADRAAVYATAREAGIRYVISGELLPGADGVMLSVRASDLRAGVDIAAQSHPNLRGDNLVSTARKIAVSISQALNLPREQALATLAADFAADDFAAYESYIAGLNFYNDFRFEDAANAMRAALTISPDFHMARFRLANIELSEGKFAEAEATLEQIPQDAALEPREAGYINALRHLASGELEQAEGTLTALLESYPYDLEARMLLAQTYRLQFKSEKAIAVLQALGEQEPENHHFWSTLGYLSALAGKDAQAEEAYERYAALAPSLPNPWSLLGDLSLKRGDSQAASTQFDRALAIDATFAPALLGRARTQVMLGSYEAAEQILSGIANDPEASPRYRVSAAFDQVALRQAVGDYDQVAPLFDPVAQVLENERSRRALALTEQGLAALRAGDAEAARTLLTAAVEAAPPEGVATRYLFARGLLEVDRREYESLRVTIDKIRSLALPEDDPDQTEAIAALQLEGLALLERGQPPAAVEKFRAAQALEGYQYRLVSTMLAVALEASGAGPQAMAAARTAMSEWPGFLASEPRLDLEIDRRRAADVGARVACTLPDRQARAMFVAALSRWRQKIPSDC